MSQEGPPEQPSLPWRVASSFTMGFIGIISRVAMKVGNRSEMHGLDEFLELLDGREDPQKRERGLITSTVLLLKQSDLELTLEYSLKSYQRVRMYPIELLIGVGWIRKS